MSVASGRVSVGSDGGSSASPRSPRPRSSPPGVHRRLPAPGLVALTNGDYLVKVYRIDRTYVTVQIQEQATADEVSTRYGALTTPSSLTWLALPVVVVIRWFGLH